MKKVRKILLISFLIPVALAGMILALPFLFKDKIIALVKTELNNRIKGASVDFERIDMRVFSSFPNLRLVIQGLRIKNNADFDHIELFHAEKTNVDIDIMSVIKGETYQIHHIGLQNTHIHALILADSSANYHIFATDARATQDTGTLFKLHLNKLLVKNAHIIYENRTNNNYYEGKGLNFTLSGNFSNKRSKLKMALHIAQTNVQTGAITCAKDIALDFKALINADFASHKYAISNNTLRLNALTLHLKGWVQMLPEGINMDLALDVPQLALKHILSLTPAFNTKDFKHIKADGDIRLQALAKGIYKYNSARLPVFNIDFSIDKGYFQYPSLPQAVKEIRADLHINNPDGIPNHTVAHLKQLHLAFADNPVDISLLLQESASDPFIDAVIKGKIDLSKLKHFIPLDNTKMTGTVLADLSIKGKKSMIDKKQYQQLKAEGVLLIHDMSWQGALGQPTRIKELSLYLSPQEIHLKNLDAHIGSSDIKMTGKITHLWDYLFSKDKNIASRLELKSRQFNFNEFVQSNTTAAPKKKHQTDTSVPLLNLPDRVDMQLIAHIDNMIYDNWHMQKFKGNIGIKNKVASLRRISFSLLDADFILNGVCNAQYPQQPEISLDAKITHLDIQKALSAFPAIAAMSPITKECFGTANCHISFNTLLSEKMQPIYPSLIADGKIFLPYLRLKGDMSSKTFGLIKKLRIIEPEVKNVPIQFSMRNGIISVLPFPLNTGALKGTCKLTYNLEGNVDMEYKVLVPTPLMQHLLEDKLSEVSQVLHQAKENGIHEIPLQHIGIIITAQGQTHNLKYSLKIDPYFTDNLKTALGAMIRKKTQQAKNKVKEEGRKQLEKIKLKKEKILEEGRKKLKDILRF